MSVNTSVFNNLAPFSLSPYAFLSLSCLLNPESIPLARAV